MLQLCVCRDIEHLGSLESTRLKRLELLSAVPRATLMPLSCSPNVPRAQYLDIRTLMHELIVKLKMCVFLRKQTYNLELTLFSLQ